MDTIPALVQRGARRGRVAAGLALVLWLCALSARADAPAVPPRSEATAAAMSFDAVVEAVRQTVVAVQVAGAVLALEVKAGDRVKAGQVLVRLDARAARLDAQASRAQVEASRAALEAAAREYERQQGLFAKRYISQAALERAEAGYKASRAQLDAQLAQAGVAGTQTDFHVVRAPYAGVVAEVPVALGDMAMPGRPLLTLYDPSALRVSAAVPQSIALRWSPERAPRIELPGLATPGPWVVPLRTQVLPTVDAATHTVQMRADLPVGLAGVAPGMFARLWLSAVGHADAAPKALFVPLQALVRRAEMTGLYVVGAGGKPVLRQVRTGRIEGDAVEILSGLSADERVVSDPQAAARAR